MATLKSAACIANYAPDAPDGNVKARIGTWEHDVDGSASASDVIQMVPVPAGAQIIDVLVQWTALASSCTFDVGDGNTADKYFDALDGDAVGRASLYGGMDAGGALDENEIEYGVANVGYEYTSADTIDITLHTAGTESGDKITMIVLYKVEGGIADET